MSEERLRLIAEFRDNASRGVKQLGKNLGEVRETPGMTSAARWMKGFELNAKAIQQAGAGAGSVMGALGVGGLALSGGIAAAVKNFKDLAEQTSTLQSISRETGIAVTQLNVFRNAAKDLHVDPEKMTAGLQYLTGQLEQARRGIGDLAGTLNAFDPEFARKIENEDATAAAKDVFAKLAGIPDAYVKAGRSLADGIQAQKQWTEKLLGDAGLNRLVEQGPNALNAALAAAAKNTPVVTQAMIDAAEALHKSVDELDRAIDKIQTKAAPTIFKGMSDIVGEFNTTIDNLERFQAWVEKARADPGKAMSAADDESVMVKRWGYQKRYLTGEGDFTAAHDGGEAQRRLDAYTAERAGLAGKTDNTSVARGEELDIAVRRMKRAVDEFATATTKAIPKGPANDVPNTDGNARRRWEEKSGTPPNTALPTTTPQSVPSNDPSTLNKLRDAMKAGVQPAPIILPPTLQPASATPVPHPVSRAPAPMVVTPASPVQPAPRPAPPPIPQPMPRVELPQPAPRPAPPPIQQPDPAMQGLFQLNAYHGEERPSLLQRTAYHEGDDESGERRGGMGSLTAEFREVISSGTKAGVMAAFRELTQERDMETTTGGRGRGGIMNASFEVGCGGSAGAGARGAGGTSGGSGGAYGGGPAGHRAPSLRYNRPHENAPFKPTDDGAVPTGAHTPLKDLIAQHETGGTGATGYGTAYGHAEQPGSKMHALAPPKPLTDMSLSEVLAYQREMKPKAGSPAFPVGRAQWTESTLRGLTRGMDPNTKFTPELQEKLFDRSIAGRMGQGAQGFRNEWDSLRGVQSGEIDAAVEGHRKAMAQAATVAPKPTLHAGDGKMPAWMDGKSQRELAGVNKGLAGDLLAASEATGQHFRVLQGLRTQAEANHNAATGRGVRNSQHLYGAAADIRLTDDKGRDLDRNDPSWNRYAQAYEAHSRAAGGQGRWLGHVPGWSWDRAHFDQGIGYGEHHARDPFGVHGPTKDDVAQGNKEIFKSPDNPFLAKAHDQLAGKTADTLSAAHRLLKWADKASKADDPDGTLITTVDRRDPRFAPYPEPPRKSLLDEANKAGLGSTTTIKHEGGASLEVRFKNAPAPIQGTRVRTHGMIEAVNLRRGGLTPEVV